MFFLAAIFSVCEPWDAWALGRCALRVRRWSLLPERRGWVRPHEKGDKDHEIPTHRNLERYLEEYIAAPTSARTAKESDYGRGRILSLRFALANQSSAKRPRSDLKPSPS